MVRRRPGGTWYGLQRERMSRTGATRRQMQVVLLILLIAIIVVIVIAIRANQ